jgi:rare lipoprotein A
MSSVLSRVLASILMVGLVTGCASNPKFTEYGDASWHGPFFLSRESRTASGKKWWNFKMVAAHKTLPLFTQVYVTNLNNQRTVKVKIIDRGPYIEGRIIDLSPRAARKLGMKDEGVAPVKLQVY